MAAQLRESAINTKIVHDQTMTQKLKTLFYVNKSNGMSSSL